MSKEAIDIAGGKTDEIRIAVADAVIRTCEACNAPSVTMAGGFASMGRSVGSSEVRQVLDIWWRFNLLTGKASGESNAFADGHHFENV